MVKFYFALWAAKAVNAAVKLVASNRGSDISGRIALRIDPLFISHVKGTDPSRVLIITGTNGKSTTNNLINHILTDNGIKVVSNLEGANLITGVCTALVKAAGMNGRVNADCFIFETDERYVAPVRKQLPAKNILVTNLQKDQVQRNGDPDFIIRKLSAGMTDGKIRFFLNNEEPRSLSLGKFADSIVTYGVKKHGEAFVKDDSYVTMPCPVCHHKLLFDYYNTDGIGSFRCSHCGYSSAEHADYEIDGVDFENRTFSMNGNEFAMPYNTPYMLYNYAAAVAVAHEFAGLDEKSASASFSSFKNIGGRFEIIHYKGKIIKYMRIKQENPETLQTSLNIIANDPERKMVAMGLCRLVDMIPHYANTFYAYDCDWSGVVKSNVEKFFIFSDRVSYDTANRLIYEGADPDIISVADNEDIIGIFKEIESAETDNIYLVTWLHTYEAMEKYLKQEGAVNE